MLPLTRITRLALATLLAAVLSPTARATATATPPALRLPAGVRPIHGAVALRIVPGEPTFSGSVDFEIQLDHPTALVWLNQHELRLSDATITFGGKSIAAQTLPSGDYVGVSLPHPVGPGRAKLHLAFAGDISEAQIVGLFHVKDRGHDLVVSKFESIFARRAFPCFDEPGFKIPWQLTLQVRQGDAAFSNTPELRHSDDGKGMKTIVFAETPPLPSYLVALAVGALERVDVGRAGRHGVPVGLVVPVGHAGETAWARQIAAPIVERLEQYFDIPFPYPKLDLLIVPQYPGGMEDAGLILLGSSGLLGDATRLSINNKRGAAHVLMHEIAHMWFGDSVTSAWWDDIWLNEAFASWADAKLVAEWQPSWNAVDVVARARANAFAADSLASARRIRQPIATADDILNAFDAITYQKGETVLAMLERWIGPEQFRRGVHDYLVAHANGSATSADFVSTMAKAAGKDVAPVFASFTDQQGIPLVLVSLRCASGAKPSVALQQMRFTAVGAKEGDARATSWQVPVCLKTPSPSGTTRDCTVMTGSSDEVPLDEGPCPAWVLANDEEAGYFLALYPRPLIAQLVAHRAQLSLRERLGLVHDLTRLVEAGRKPADEVLSAQAAFAGDADPTVARAALMALEQEGEQLVAPARRAGWQRFLGKAVGARARQLGWAPATDEPDNVRLLRPHLLSLAAIVAGDKTLSAEGAALGRRWLDVRGAVDPDVRTEALTLAAHRGDSALWERMRAEAVKETDPTSRMAIIRALVAFTDRALRDKGLDFILSPDVNGRETYGAYFAIAAGDPDAPAIRLGFVERHYDQLLARFPPNRAGDLIEALAQCDSDGRKRLADFFATRAPRMTGGPRALAHALEATDQCIAGRAVADKTLGDLFGK